MARTAIAEKTSQAEKASALVALEPIHDVSVAAPVYSSDPDFGADDITYPRLKLLQAISPEVLEAGSNLKPGLWYITGDDAGRQEVVLVPLGYHLSRRYDIGTMEDKTLLCQSSNGVDGVAMAPGGPGGKCADCPMALWSEDPATGRRVLPCQPSYNYVCYVPDFGIVSVSLSRTATPTAKTLNGYLKVRGFGNLAVQLKSSQVKAPGKIYYVPALRIVKAPEVIEDAKLMMPS